MPVKESHGSLIVEPPSQVRFHGPFTRPVITTVTLINPTDYKIIFKIKTTAPTYYGVRPNFGVVQPRNFVEVEIARQPFNYDQTEKINHKFMVQSLMVPSNVEDLNRVWETADPTQLHSSKLRCVFEMPSSITQPKTTNLTPSVKSDAGTSMMKSSHSLHVVKQPTSGDNFTKTQLDSLNQEMRQLNSENKALRKENIMLKDEIEQMRTVTTRAGPAVTPNATNNPPVPFVYALTSVSIAVLSIFLGKYVL